MFGFFKRKKSKEHNKEQAHDTTILHDDNQVIETSETEEAVQETAVASVDVTAAADTVQTVPETLAAIAPILEKVNEVVVEEDEESEALRQAAAELKAAADAMAAQSEAHDAKEDDVVSRETEPEATITPVVKVEAVATLPEVAVAEVPAIETPAVETVVETVKEVTIAAEPEPVALVVSEVAAEPEKPAKLGWAARLKKGLSKSRTQLAKSLAGVFGGGQIDEDLYEELETVLLTSDMGLEATEHLLTEVRNRVSLRGLKNGDELREALKESLLELIAPLEAPLVLPEGKGPFVIMMAGVNGAGKTTSIGKLAKYFQGQGKSVLLAAGDTFRAAAREQLIEWGDRNQVTVISQASGDSAAVCFDAMEAAKARGVDVVLADTAGRLPTQMHLMEEIKKVKRVIQKALPEAPQEIILVLDANIGQNAINQVVAFDDALGLTGLILTKLDGTAKGGIVAALAKTRPVPVRFIGVGESIDDLRPFKAKEYVDALLDEHETH